jgi:hypothetical protein
MISDSSDFTREHCFFANQKGIRIFAKFPYLSYCLSFFLSVAPHHSHLPINRGIGIVRAAAAADRFIVGVESTHWLMLLAPKSVSEGSR